MKDILKKFMIFFFNKNQQEVSNKKVEIRDLFSKDFFDNLLSDLIYYKGVFPKKYENWTILNFYFIGRDFYIDIKNDIIQEVIVFHFIGNYIDLFRSGWMYKKSTITKEEKIKIKYLNDILKNNLLKKDKLIFSLKERVLKRGEFIILEKGKGQIFQVAADFDKFVQNFNNEQKNAYKYLLIHF